MLPISTYFLRFTKDDCEQALVKRVQNYQNISVTKNLLEKYFFINKLFVILRRICYLEFTKQGCFIIELKNERHGLTLMNNTPSGTGQRSKSVLIRAV